MWAQGLLHLLLLFHFSGNFPQSHSVHLKEKLAEMQVRPSSYTWPQFQVPNAVYCKVQVDWTPRNVYKQPSPMMYVGSTSLRVSQREWNRMAVVRRIQTNPHVQAELAIRYWNSKRNFQQFTIFKIAHCADYRQAWVLEHQLIQRWQPRLNVPFISRFLQRKALGFRTSSQRRRSVAFRFGKRLWAKLRKRLFGSRLPVSICVSRQQAWEYVFDLQSATKAAFDAARTLRSAKVTDQEVYALLKLTHALEQPGRAKVLGFFRSICKFRNMSWPGQSRSLQLPFLAQDSFAAEVQQWLKSEVILRFKDILIPFHLSSHKLREAAHPSVRDQLFNFRKWETRLAEPGGVPCTCDALRASFPSLQDCRGHVAAGLETLTELPSHLRQVTGANSFFPNRTTYFAEQVPRFRRWCRQHGVPLHVVQDFERLLDRLWLPHATAVREQGRTDWRAVQKIRHIFAQTAVLHCEDHQPQHLMLFCPRGYFDGCLATWNDPNVFQALEGTQASWSRQLHSFIPGIIRRKYSWGIRNDCQLPFGFVLLKRKKSFEKGRGIISYRRSVMEDLLRGTAAALQLMVRTVWPEALGLESLPQLFNMLHLFLQSTTEPYHLTECNDDLVGFFNAVPQREIILSVQSLLEDFRRQHGSIHISVDLRSLPNFERAFLGKLRRANTANTSPKRTFQPLCKLLLTPAFSGPLGLSGHRLMERQSGTKSVPC